MTEQEKERESERKIRYITYGLVFMVMIGYHCASDSIMGTENMTYSDSELTGESYYKMPRISHIISQIYDVSICGKYYRADETCRKILLSLVQNSKS